jgi:hypothetical protein
MSDMATQLPDELLAEVANRMAPDLDAYEVMPTEEVFALGRRIEAEQEAEEPS